MCPQEEAPSQDTHGHLRSLRVCIGTLSTEQECQRLSRPTCAVDEGRGKQRLSLLIQEQILGHWEQLQHCPLSPQHLSTEGGAGKGAGGSQPPPAEEPVPHHMKTRLVLDELD